jgi:Rad50 zinc hook motif
MSFAPHSRRFDPRLLFPAKERNAAGTSEVRHAIPISSDDRSTNDLTERDFDDALEQVASEKGRVCPLCGRSRRAMDL